MNLMSTLREWQQQGSDVAVLDLCPAFLQIHHCSSFRPWKSREPDTALPDWDLVSTWLLTSWRQSWMWSERRMRTFKRQHLPTLMMSSSMNVLSFQVVKKLFEHFGLTCKEPEPLQNGVKVLELHISSDRERLCWRRGDDAPEVPLVITR